MTTQPSTSRCGQARLRHSLRTVYGENCVRVMGTIDTTHGIVRVGGWYDTSGKHVTRFDFIYQGEEYTRFYDRRFSDRYLVTLARRMAEDARAYYWYYSSKKDWA